MSVGTIQKQPYEVQDYSLDFALRLVAGETLTLVSVTSINLATGADSTSALVGSSPPPAVSGTKVVFWLKDGVDGEHHKVTVKVTTSTGQSLEGDIDVFVVEE